MTPIQSRTLSVIKDRERDKTRLSVVGELADGRFALTNPLSLAGIRLYPVAGLEPDATARIEKCPGARSEHLGRGAPGGISETCRRPFRGSGLRFHPGVPRGRRRGRSPIRRCSRLRPGSRPAASMSGRPPTAWRSGIRCRPSRCRLLLPLVASSPDVLILRLVEQAG